MSRTRTGRGIKDTFTACTVIPLEPGISRRDAIQAIVEEVELEREARMSEPFICIDANGNDYALYISEQELAPLGVSLRRHFATFSDFLWAERTSYGGKDGESWSAVLVRDGLAMEEMIDAPKSELRRIAADIHEPIPTISQHRLLLESWLPKAMGAGGKTNWVELAVSPLSGSGNLAKLEQADKAMKTAKLKITLPPITQGLMALGLVITLAAGGIYFFLQRGNTTSLRTIDPIEVRMNRERIWLSKFNQYRPTAASLEYAYDLLLQAWSLGLPVNRLRVENKRVTLHFASEYRTEGEMALAQVWANMGQLELATNEEGDILQTAAGTIPGEAFIAHDSKTMAIIASPDQLLDDTALENIAHLYSPHLKLNPSIERSPEGKSLQTIRLNVPSGQNPGFLLAMAADPRLHNTYITSLNTTVDSEHFTTGANLELVLGGWKELGEAGARPVRLP